VQGVEPCSTSALYRAGLSPLHRPSRLGLSALLYKDFLNIVEQTIKRLG